MNDVIQMPLTFLHSSENKPKNGGICVANHTSPIDVIILASDGCYAMVAWGLLWFCASVMMCKEYLVLAPVLLLLLYHFIAQNKSVY